MEVGDLVWFPCDRERYQPRVGIWLGNHDNPADVGNSPYAKKLAESGRPPRQVADILYNGKHMTCWATHLRRINDA